MSKTSKKQKYEALVDWLKTVKIVRKPKKEEIS
jgi:hypothetical protein